MNSCSEGHKFISCYLIGEDSLAGSCVKTILECGYVLLGICSHSEQIKDFAAQKNIPCTNSIEVFASWVRANKCDFLFSIVNSRILSKDLITLPRYFAINYHNAVLPKYAGVHATSWALLNNEQFHGVTWHVMAEGIDTGDILKQATFKIDDQETNFTLDVKCIEKAVPLFRELLAELVEGKYKRIKQDLDRRSYYTLYQKPKHWGVVTWVSSTASEIYRLHRALNFVGRANKLCLPKFIFNEAPFFAKHVTILNKKKKYSPGTIIELSDKYLRVATLTEDIGLSQLTDINGKSYGAAELAAFVGFKKGEKLSSLKKEFLQQLELHGEQLVKDESFWIRALEQIKNLEFGIFNSHEDVVHKETNIIKTLIYADKSFKNKISLLLPATSDTTHALMAIFLLYLYRLNNYDDFSVGYSNQYLKKLETDMDNFFADIVPMNLCFTPNIGWRQAAVKVTGLLNLIEKHKTFAKDVVLRYPQLSEQLISYPIIISTTEPHKKMLDRIKNSLYFVINEDSINLYFSANLDATKQKIIDSMSGHLQILVDKLLLNNKQAIGNLSILTAQEEQLILEDWNNTTRPYPRDLSVAQLFEQQVDKYPNNVAVKCKNILLTYRELNQKANQLGFYLSSLGIKGGSLVATYFDKGINSIIGILSVLKTGAAYIPIDPMYPKQHIRYILEDTGVFIILTQEKNRKTLEECLPSGKFILLSVDNANANQNIFIVGKNISNLVAVIKPTSLAYVMYTSGSTGVPKGVMINHRAIIRLVKDTDYIQFVPDDSVAQVASMSFDASTFEIWGSLLNGAKLVCADNNTVSNAESFADFLDSEKISVMVLVSAVFDQHAAANPAMFKGLKCLLVGGDILNVETIYAVIHCSQGAPLQVLNIYGPTENATSTTIFSIPKDFNKNKAIPIGKPIANTSVYVLDKYLNPMPVGIPGELCTGGDGLSSGYWRKESMTKEKFIDITLNNKKLKLYKIGDLVRWLADGNIDYICRLDNQVKVRGFRIELEAIELCLLNCDRVSQCAVVVRQDKKMRKTLAAYLVVKDFADDNISFVRQFLGNHLPPYMVPNVFIIMDKLPLTPNGKVDKKSLPLKVQEQIEPSENCVYPRSELEYKLASIWKELLNLDVISVNDGFFHLGGHSLLITEMMVNIKKQINAEFPLHVFLETPTLANLVRLIELQNNKDHAPNALGNVTEVLLNDIFLDPSIKPLPLSASLLEKPDAVLLTGVTGFLGAFMLNDICRLSNAKIYCLIRADNLDEASKRLRNTLTKYKLDGVLTFYNDRVTIVVGDLAKSLLGLDQATFDLLSEEVDYIYHCGAYVHHIYNYETLRNSNVLSTLEILKLAISKKNKQIHYVSTLSTTVNYPNDNGFVVEDFFYEAKLPLEGLSGYVQTKLASEILLAKAYQRGVQVFIYRPSWIVGSKDTGVCSMENNHLFLLLKGCMQVGYAPKLKVNLNMFPVDFVSELIVRISLNGDKIKQRVFNMVNPYDVSWSSLFKCINSFGYKVKMVSALNWGQKHLEKIDKDNAIYPLVSLYHADGGVNWAVSQSGFSNIGNDNTKTAMKIFDLNDVKIDDTTLRCYFEQLRQDDFMPSIDMGDAFDYEKL